MFNLVRAVGIICASLLLPPLLVGACSQGWVPRAACEGASLYPMHRGAGGEPHFWCNQEGFEDYSQKCALAGG